MALILLLWVDRSLGADQVPRTPVPPTYSVRVVTAKLTPSRSSPNRRAFRGIHTANRQDFKTSNLGADE